MLGVFEHYVTSLFPERSKCYISLRVFHMKGPKSLLEIQKSHPLCIFFMKFLYAKLQWSI